MYYLPSPLCSIDENVTNPSNAERDPFEYNFAISGGEMVVMLGCPVLNGM